QTRAASSGRILEGAVGRRRETAPSPDAQRGAGFARGRPTAGGDAGDPGVLAMIIADTDVLIDYLQGKGTTADRIALELDRAQLYTTAVTRFELLAGAKSARQEKLVTQLLEALPCLPLDSAAADHAAAVRRTLEKRGQS